MYRRKYLKTTGIGGIATILAGCLSENGGETPSDEQAAEDPDPDPTVINTEAEGDFGTILSGEVDVAVEVENRGGEGDVEVILDVRDGSGSRVNTETQLIHMGEDETTVVDFAVSVDDGAEHYEALVAPA